MARNRQDEFKSSVIEQLRKRSANRCSNPDCKKLTSSPQISNPNKVNDTGIAAHIAAASEKGPRYDKSMTSEQRSSIENAIWLCAHHATIIDREPESYPIEMLKEWKRNNEMLIRASVNEQILTDQEVQQKVAKKILSSIGVENSEKISNSISDISKSIEDTVSKLDPRVSIKYSYDNGFNRYQIFSQNSKIDPVVLYIEPKNNSEYLDKFNNLIEHGNDFSTELINFSSNSLGLNYVFPTSSDGAIVKVINNKREDIRVELEDNNENLLIILNGEITFGNKSFSIISSSLDDVLEFRIEKFLVNEEKSKVEINLKVEKWNNKNVLDLVNFDRINKLYKKFRILESISANIYMKSGKEFNINLNTKNDFFKNLTTHLDSIHLVRKLSKLLELSFIYDCSCPMTMNDYNYLQYLYSEIEPLETDSLYEHVFYIQVEDKDAIDILKNGSDFKYENQISLEKLNIFGEILDTLAYIQYQIFQPEIFIECIDKEEKKWKVTCKVSGGDSKFIRTISKESSLDKLLK